MFLNKVTLLFAGLSVWRVRTENSPALVIGTFPVFLTCNANTIAPSSVANPSIEPTIGPVKATAPCRSAPERKGAGRRKVNISIGLVCLKSFFSVSVSFINFNNLQKEKIKLTRMVSQLNYGERRRATGYELFVSFVPFCRTH